MLSSESSDEGEPKYHPSAMEGAAEFIEVSSKAEKKRMRDAAIPSEDSDDGKMKTAKKIHTAGEDRGATNKMDPRRNSSSSSSRANLNSDVSCMRKWTGSLVLLLTLD